MCVSYYCFSLPEQSSPFGKFSHIDELISDLKRQLRKELREEGAHLQDKGNGLTNLNEIFELLHAIRQVREPEPQTNTARYITISRLLYSWLFVLRFYSTVKRVGS